MTKEKIIEAIEKMSVLELSELVKDLEDKFGVTAMAPISAVAAASGAAQAVPVEEKTEFDVVLNGFDAAKKINVIKAVREVMQLGLKESKDLVEAAEKEVQKIKESLPKKDAEELKKKLEEAGAKVELK
ncbi:MAG: 50S ribosomal protein L7/L12 [Caldiserica bacterium CG02_land_8_20_14_3_00_36_38]|nr:50S ribosomal protein L7/L12 [Caldisericota bacterium]OIP13596.1 MAG: 50S ribosomal protein L7/L12 [Caldisericum sp. CG2_30_36_11]PIP50112.1 MAG: 50S ribosomal protein L7/L12 [Caldiserica bacterium CG23_combo_of_CG06-09_8_20_14_all_35_60]PIV55009.1 MAG: 50S ribosomal protein L7/L12 [Caldiserica bacterium CG02_land_8_20_14_3_00_36_38]PIW10950.1 MAG: 50S ribosomal protein L7/L12 [Caldiserica bacterium CG17_big_fil_post_rev_8_21_14_2_50_35_7]PIX28448.1 MAG: 50S ribosomal protein L7/L12 [Caldis